MARPPGKKRGSRVNRSGRNTGRAGARRKSAGRYAGTSSTSKSQTQFKPADKTVADTATVILLNKPYGIVSQFSGDDKTLADLVPIKNVYPAGRLDKDSEGLLLLTDHGALQHRISHPKMKWHKRYWVQVEGEITDSDLQQLRNGVHLKDGNATAISAERIQPPDLWARNPPVRYRASIPDCWIDLTLNEGRNRQVRRMTAAIGFPTLRLIRHTIGHWNLSNIKSGKYQTFQLSGSTLSDLLD